MGWSGTGGSGGRGVQNYYAVLGSTVLGQHLRSFILEGLLFLFRLFPVSLSLDLVGGHLYFIGKINDFIFRIEKLNVGFPEILYRLRALPPNNRVDGWFPGDFIKVNVESEDGAAELIQDDVVEMISQDDYVEGYSLGALEVVPVLLAEVFIDCF